jgi:alkanesulfonate monooxygenase SsuD/methylene tetrahydromethanopterin reductase-like flavin-dependent oxidoreductase (luciferase family)
METWMLLSALSISDHYPDRERSLSALYAEVLEHSVLADELGYHAFFFAEHHFHQYGAVPNPAVLLASIAARTKRLRLGTAISVLPFRNPALVAEDYAMLDVISNGRLALGVGSGYLKHEFAGFGIDATEKRDRFEENLDLLERFLRGERVTYTGRFASFDGIKLNVLPIQHEVPIYVATLRKEGAYYIGRQGRRMMSVPYATLDNFEEIGELVSEFHRGRRDAGLPGNLSEATNILLHTHVAASDAEARRNAAAAFDLYVASRLYAKSAVYDDVIRNGLALFGSVETVAAKMCRLAEMGVEHLMSLHNFGLMPDAQARRSMRMMIEEVVPRVRAATPDRAPKRFDTMPSQQSAQACS